MKSFFGGQTWSECHKVNRRKYAPMWCPEQACLKQENTEFSYFALRERFETEKNALLCGAPLGLVQD